MSLYDPSAFGGKDDFLRQMDFVAESCRSNPPRPGVEQVRMPGDRGMQRRALQLKEGVALHPTIAPMLRDAAVPYGLSFPSALS
jgi:L-lactate dehydrogenase